MKTTKTFFCFIFTAILLMSFPALGVNLISMNFAENTNQVFAGGEMIGPLKTNSTYWNNTGANIPSGTMNDLMDKYGVPTTADVSWESKNCWYNSDGTGSDEARLAVGYLDDGDDGPSFIVSSIPFSTYNAYILFTSDQNGDYTHGSLTVNGTVIFDGPFPAHGRVTDGTGWVECDGTIYGNYVKVNNLSGALTVSAVADTGRAPLTAFIVEEIPDSVYVENFSPAVGATRIGQDVQLSWEVFNATGTPSFNVYLSDDPNKVDPALDPNTPATPVTTTPDTFYTPASPLDPATRYYWRIDVADDANTVPLTGHVLTFTTGGDVVNLYPVNGATGVATDLTITWTGDSEGSTYIDEYAIYFGETLPATPTATVTESQWQPPELSDGTAYQCKVVSLHLGTPVIEATTSFTTGALVGYWPFDDNLTDMVGSNDGTRDNPHFTEGVIGSGAAAEFYGDEPVTLAIPDAATGGNWAISFWEYSDPQIGGGWETIVGNGAGPDGWEIFEFGRYNFNRYVFGIDGNYQYTPDDSSYLRGGWQYHVISYDSTAKTGYWYINGAQVKEYTGLTVTLHGELSVGNVSGGSQPFTGRIDDFKVYSRPLSAAQVLQVFIDDLAGKPYNPNPAVGTTNMSWDPALGWRFAETPDSAVIEIGKEPDLSDAAPIVLAGDLTSFDVYTGLGIHLTPSTGYYWRVTPTYAGTPVVGPIWYFVVRDLLSDLSDNLAVGTEDIIQLSSQWLDDSFEIVQGGEQYPFIDQEAWGDDPNLANYDAYVPAGGAWGSSVFSVNTNPTPSDDPNNFVTPSQTLLWTATGTAGQQQLAGIVFPRGPIDLREFDKIGFWCRQTGCEGNFQFRPLDLNGNRSDMHTVWGMSPNNDHWYNYEWTIGEGEEGAPTVVYKVDIWVGDNEFTIEYANFYVVKDGIEVLLCFEENCIAEDLNKDCIVNLFDYEIMAQDWLLDARN